MERGLAELIHEGVLYRDIVDSLRRVAIGYFAAVFLGIPLGLLFGWYPARQPSRQSTRADSSAHQPDRLDPRRHHFLRRRRPRRHLPRLSRRVLSHIVTCVDSVANVPLIYRRAGSNFGFTPPQLLARVVFPAALPQILVGLRIALGIGWLVVVAGEMIAVNSGLGYLIIDSRNSGKRYDLVVGAMLLIGVIGLMLDLLFRRIETMKPVRWGFRNES